MVALSPLLSKPLPVLLCLIALGGQAATASDLMIEADETFRARRYAEALPLYESAATAARQEGDRSTEVEALAQVARMYSATERLELGRPVLEQARELASPEQPLGWTRYLGVRGIFERESGDRNTALATFAQMFEDAMRLGLPLRAIDAAHHAAIVAPPDLQVVWARRGIAAAEAAGSEGWLAVLWNNLGATYDWDLKDYPKAVECYEKARYFHHLGGKAHAMLVADWALGRAALLAGDLDRAEDLLRPAAEEARRRLDAARTKSTLEWAGNTGWWYGEALERRYQMGQGLRPMEEAREHLVAAGIEDWWPEGLAELDERIDELSRFVENISQ